MKRIKKSFGYALEGLVHAISKERNLQLFIPCYIVVLILGGIVKLLAWEWMALMVAGGIFLTTELLNTALERLSDALDHERKLLGRRAFHEGIKATKDVAASASLMALVTVMIVIGIVFWPYANLYLF